MVWPAAFRRRSPHFCKRPSSSGLRAIVKVPSTFASVIGGPLWDRMLALPRGSAAALTQGAIPSEPGVYVWFRDGEPIYAGRAVATGGLRRRLWRSHLATGLDLSHSSFRRNVCEHVLGIPTSVTRQRPTVMRADQVKKVNEWIRGCEVAWIELRTVEETKQFERSLMAEWMPPLSKR